MESSAEIHVCIIICPYMDFDHLDQLMIWFCSKSMQLTILFTLQFRNLIGSSSNKSKKYSVSKIELKKFLSITRTIKVGQKWEHSLMQNAIFQELYKNFGYCDFQFLPKWLSKYRMLQPKMLVQRKTLPRKLKNSDL